MVYDFRYDKNFFVAQIIMTEWSELQSRFSIQKKKKTTMTCILISMIALVMLSFINESEFSKREKTIVVNYGHALKRAMYANSIAIAILILILLKL